MKAIMVVYTVNLYLAKNMLWKFGYKARFSENINLDGTARALELAVNYKGCCK